MRAGGHATPISDVKQGLCGGSPTEANCNQAIDANQAKYYLPDQVPDEAVSIYQAVSAYCGKSFQDRFTEDAGACVASVLSRPQEFNHTKQMRRPLTPTRGNTVPQSVGKMNLSNAASALHFSLTPATTVDTLFSEWQRRNAPAPTHQTVAAPEFDEAGARVKNPFSPKVEDLPSPDAVHGGAALEVTPSGKGTGLDGSFSLDVPLLHGPGYKLGFHGGMAVTRFGVVKADPQASLVQAYYGGDWWTTPEFFATGSIPLGGTFVSVPKVNLIEANTVASEMEATIKARLGGKAGDIYINSVLGPTMAAMNPTTEDGITYVITRVQAFTSILQADSLASGENLVLANMFQHDPSGVIDFLALRSGKTEKEVGDALKSAGFDFNGSDQAAEFIKVVTVANTLGRHYETPAGIISGDDFIAKTTSLTAQLSILSLKYGEVLGKQEGEVINATGANRAELMADAVAAHVDYPFENIPDNPWAAQKRYNDFEAAVLNKKHVQAPKGTLTLDFGNMDVAYYILTQFGARASVDYKLTDQLAVGGFLFLGTGNSNPLNLQEETTFADGGFAWSIGANGSYAFKYLGVGAGVTYSPHGSDMAGYPDFLGTKLALSHKFAVDENWSITPSAIWKGRFDTANDRTRNFFIGAVGADRSLESGNHVYIDTSLMRMLGTVGGDHTPLTSSSPFGDSVNGDTPGDSSRRIFAGANAWDAKASVGYGKPGDWKAKLGIGWSQLSNWIDTGSGSGESGAVSGASVILGAEKTY